MTRPVYLLDTNIIIYLRRKRPPTLIERLTALAPGEAAISAITFGELHFGAWKSGQGETAISAVDQLAARLAVLDLPIEASRRYGMLRASLERQGLLIGGNDLWIAAHALASDLVLITNNTREFERVDNLKVENWAV
ncbi:MAG: type II toxin-antitoxin system VapC family toxin [Labrys sp. (in: a-proteobacteria)]